MLWSHFTKPDEGWVAKGSTNVGPYRGWKRAEDAHTHIHRRGNDSQVITVRHYNSSPQTVLFFHFVYLETPMASFSVSRDKQVHKRGVQTHTYPCTPFFVSKLSAPHTWCTDNLDLQTPHAHKGTQKSHANPSARKRGFTCERKKDDLTPAGKVREVGEKRE